MWIYLVFNALAVCGAAAVAALHRAGRMKGRLVRTTALCLLPAAAFVSWANWRQFRFADFKNCYFLVGQRIVAGLPPHYEAMARDAFVNLPILGWEFAPFGVLGRTAGTLAFTAAGIVASYLAYRLCRRLTGGAEAAVALLAGGFLINGPLIYSLAVGNDAQVALLGLAGGLVLLEEDSPVLAGLVLALVAVNKIPLLIFGPLLVLRREMIALASFSITLVLLIAASIGVYGVALHRDWAATCLIPYGGGLMGAFNNQSLDAVLARTFLGANPYAWLPVAIPPGLRVFRFLVLAAVVALPVAAARWARPADPKTARRLDFAAAITVAVLVSPVSWTHYEALLLLPIAILLGLNWTWSAHRARILALVVACALLTQPVVWWEAHVPAVRFVLDRILLAYGTVGTAILLALLALLRLRPGRTISP